MNAKTATNFYGDASGSWRLDGFTLSESVYPSNLKMPVHRHEPAYLGIVLKGAYSETVATRTRYCKQLSTIFHPPGESHSVTFHDSNVRVFRIEMGEGLRHRIQDYASIADEPAEFQGGLLASLAFRLYNEYRNRDEWSALAIEGLLLEIVAELSRRRAKNNHEMPRWLEHVRETLCSRVTCTPSLAELALDIGVHPVHLARAFRKNFDCTVGEFVRRLRIEKACREILESNATISEIALASGFYDQSHFSNTFKRFTGMTPAAYRATCRPS